MSILVLLVLVILGLALLFGLWLVLLYTACLIAGLFFQLEDWLIRVRRRRQAR